MVNRAQGLSRFLRRGDVSDSCLDVFPGDLIVGNALGIEAAILVGDIERRGVFQQHIGCGTHAGVAVDCHARNGAFLPAIKAVDIGKRARIGHEVSQGATVGRVDIGRLQCVGQVLLGERTGCRAGPRAFLQLVPAAGQRIHRLPRGLLGAHFIGCSRIVRILPGLKTSGGKGLRTGVCRNWILRVYRGRWRWGGRWWRRRHRQGRRRRFRR